MKTLSVQLDTKCLLLKCLLLKKAKKFCLVDLTLSKRSYYYIILRPLAK